MMEEATRAKAASRSNVDASAWVLDLAALGLG